MDYLLLDHVRIIIYKYCFNPSAKNGHELQWFISPRSCAGDSDDSWPLDAGKKGIRGQAGRKMELYFSVGF